MQLNLLSPLRVTLLILAAVLSGPCPLQASDAPGQKQGHKQKEAHEGSPPAALYDEIRDLAGRAERSIEYEDNEHVADSLYQVAIRVAESSYNKRLILESYLQYLQVRGTDFSQKSIEEVIGKTSELIPSMSGDPLHFEANEAICNAYIEMSDAGNSLPHSMKLTMEANAANDPAKKARAYLLAGAALEISNKTQDAFENYLKAEEYISQLDGHAKDELLQELDDRLFEFYIGINQFEKAAEHKTRQIYRVEHHKPVDSIKLMWLKTELCRLRLIEEKTIELKPKLEEVIEFSERRGLKRMFNHALSIYRSILLNTQDLKGFRELFVDRYPGELEYIRKQLPSLYYTIQAYLMEEKGAVDSAILYFGKAEAEVILIDHDIYSANFYSRMGEFLLRNDRHDEALASFKTAFEKARNRDYLNYMLETSGYVDSLASLAGDYEVAYAFSKVHNDLTNRKVMALHEDDMLKMELKSQERQMAFEMAQREEQQRRKENLQYMIIIIFTVSLFVILILVSSMTVPEWLIEMLGFMSILFFFEFIILLLDTKIHHLTHGAPLQIFLIKIAILTFLFPLHHKIETNITRYMKEHKMIGEINFRGMGRTIIGILPWMKKRGEGH